MSGYATEDWVTGKGYLTGIPSTCNASVGFYAPYVRATSGMSVGGKDVATKEWVNSQLESYAKSNHTHSEYASSSHSHGWTSITGKPTSFTPASHTHSFSGSYALSIGHTHKVVVSGTTYTSQGMSTNYSKTVSISGTTGKN